MTDPMFDDERDEALALLWLDDIDDAESLAARAVDAWAPAASPTPAGLLDDIVRTASRARVGGVAAGIAPDEISPIDAYERTAADLVALLDELDGDDWDRRSSAYGTVGSIVAHLVGIERLTLGWFGELPMPPADVAADHLRVAAEAIEALADESPADVIATWTALSAEVAAAARRTPADRAVMAHDIPADRDVVMLLRTFELWAHTDDIATALGRPLLDVDAGRLLTLSRALANGLPFTFVLRGDDAPDADVRVVLTGAGGGTYDLTFGAGSPDGRVATIVVDALGACRLAQQRLSTDDLDVAIDGDRDIAQSILAHVGAFARD